MRRPPAFDNPRGALDVKMTPMIDVVFLLLVFFVWTASFQVVERLLPSSLSVAAAAGAAVDAVEPPPEAFDFDQLVIRLLWRNNAPGWQVGETPLASLAEVRGRLAAIARVKSDAPVIIDPEPDAPLGHVIDLYDAARLEGFQQVQFAAEERP